MVWGGEGVVDSKGTAQLIKHYSHHPGITISVQAGRGTMLGNQPIHQSLCNHGGRRVDTNCLQHNTLAKPVSKH
jgi:hypothetical protein